MIRKFRTFVIVTSMAFGILAFQNCGNYKTAQSTLAQDSTGSADPGSSIPSAQVPILTEGGVTLPMTYVRVISDRFGTGATRTVRTYADLHAKYLEGQYYNRDAQGRVLIPNQVINGEQQTYVHFEDAVAFAADHLTIQGRGHADGSITSAELVSVYTTRSWCVEAKYQIPNADKSWAALWWYGAASGGDSSEVDIEQPITPYQGVHDVSFHNHPYEYDTIDILTPKFTTNYMNFHDDAFDAGSAPHVYTTCYDDGSAKLSQWIDGTPIHTASWKWNKSLGGTGHGPDATTIVNLAVGGVWPGNLSDPSKYQGDLDLYYIDYYVPR